jgi:hypothetical protein
MEQYLRQGLVSDSKVLDIRQVDVSPILFFSLSTLPDDALQISDAKILDNNVPIFLVTFVTQEVLMFRNVKTGEITVGADNKVEQCVYVAAITRVEEELDHELTGGWKVIEASYLANDEQDKISRFFRWAAVVVEHTYKVRTAFYRPYIICYLALPPPLILHLF